MATVPTKPYLKSATALSTTTIRVIFYGISDGGSPILQWQIGYGSNATTPQHLVTSDGDTVVGGFFSGQRVYFWARGRNAIGWGPWSNRGQATTWTVPGAPPLVALSEKTQTSVLVDMSDASNGGTPILERQIGYGKNLTVPEFFASPPSHGIVRLIDLTPGGTYYFWARTRNAVGWGPWSVRTQTNLVAGARVRHAGLWKRAVPYVRVNGVWKVARPWVKRAGTWKDTSM